jgi:hypothetical protein
MDMPILCTLTEAELKVRRQTILKTIREAALDVVELPAGYAYRFKRTAEILTQLVKLIDLERKCCQFLTFKIVVEPGETPLRLEVTGPPKAKPVIADFFGGA